ncbi:hypothetical protein [uncultured Thermosynechococcus sp.]|uniref:hypothetical protein n=1 Tax=uncultured Thermosynechococcus sp. TaxID=436945 RepID=UPI002614AA2B|nr:hypothetical protein [uncultured Thermosynechococcus sp.]
MDQDFHSTLSRFLLRWRQRWSGFLGGKAAILEQLRQRSPQEPLVFSAKLKESGRLDLK